LAASSLRRGIKAHLPSIKARLSGLQLLVYKASSFMERHALILSSRMLKVVEALSAYYFFKEESRRK
jgi:hypothetical protein